MRARFSILLLIAFALFAAACAGGPDDGATRLAEACERQVEEVAEEEGDTPTAKSTEEKLEETTLVECAGQKTKVVAADAEADEGTDAGKDEESEEPKEDPGSGGDEAAPTELDPAARETFAGSCGSCHTLSDAETTGAVGPNLDETELDATGVRDIIENGRGAMPPGLLQGEEADAVAEYVAGAAAAA